MGDLTEGWTPIGGAPAPDAARVAAIRIELDAAYPQQIDSFGEAIHQVLTELIGRLRNAVHAADPGACEKLLSEARDGLNRLDPRRLEPKRGFAGLFDSRGGRLKRFRTAFQSAAGELADRADAVQTQAAALRRRHDELEDLWAAFRDAIRDIDAWITAGAIRLAEGLKAGEGAAEADAGKSGPLERLGARLEALLALRNDAMRRLPLIRAAQNADQGLQDRLADTREAVSQWKADWSETLGLGGRRPRRVRPAVGALANAGDQIRARLRATQDDVEKARARREEIGRRMTPPSARAPESDTAPL